MKRQEMLKNEKAGDAEELRQLLNNRWQASVRTRILRHLMPLPRQFTSTY
jgi:hypothetical protein